MGDSPERGSQDVGEHAKEPDAAAEAAAEAAAKDKPVKEKKADKKAKEEEKRPSANTIVAAKPAAPAIRYAPTYRLEPKNPMVKERLEKVVKAEMNKHYPPQYTFHPKSSLRMAATVSEDIKNRIKALNFDRYRYIVITTVGEYLMQGLYQKANFLWDAEKDGYVSYSVETPTFFAICTIFYIYFD